MTVHHANRLRKENARLTRTTEKMSATRKTKDDEIARLTRELTERERYVMGQAERLAAVNARAAQLRIQRDEAQALADARSEIDPADYEQTRRYLDDARVAYRELEDELAEMNGALRMAVQEREILRPLIQDWDRLCRMLSEATNGRPKNSRDQDTLKNWSIMRPQVAAWTTSPTKPEDAKR